MKHVSRVTNLRPFLAETEGHPSLGDALSAFFKDPVGVITLHLNAWFG